MDTSHENFSAEVLKQGPLVLQQIGVVNFKLIQAVDHCEIEARMQIARLMELVVSDWERCLVIIFTIAVLVYTQSPQGQE